MATSEVQICNRALQKLGATRIVSLTEDSVNARACNLAFEPCKLALLRSHKWNCAIKRVSLAADATEPEWGRAYSFQLPADFVALAPNYPEDNYLTKDWQIEGQKILTNETAPLYVRYIKNITDPNEMDASFREAFSCKLAFELCEALTQSNTKKDLLARDLEQSLLEARRINAIENVAEMPATDDWETARL